jgi:hypothetical protein
MLCGVNSVPYFTPKLDAHTSKDLWIFLEDSFTTVNILIQQKRGACYLAMSEELGRSELPGI